MSKSLDIVVTFNDICPTKVRRRGYVKKIYKDRLISFFDQMAIMIASIKKNWPSFNGKIYALHSEDLAEEKKELLQKQGYVVQQRKVNYFHNQLCLPLANRISAYDDIGDASHTLIVDVDTIFLSDPQLELNDNIQCSYAGGYGIEEEDWHKIFSALGITNTKITEHAFVLYHVHNKMSFGPMMNNGAILIPNKMKKEFKEKIIYVHKKLHEAGHDNIKHFPHHRDQTAMSMAFYMTPNKGLLPRGFNFMPGGLDLRMFYEEFNGDVSMYHYAGTHCQQEMQDYFSEIIEGTLGEQ